MTRPDLDDFEARAEREAELKRVGIGWRAGGIAVVVASAAVLVAARAIAGRADTPAVWIAVGGLVVGWALVGMGLWRRARSAERQTRRS